MKKLITKDDWGKYFKSKKEMMGYDREIAEKEFKKNIKKESNENKVANRISLKKWIARANGNNIYKYGDYCGYCFARAKKDISCRDCLMREVYSGCCCKQKTYMIKRFQNPKLLKLIKESEKKS